MRTAAVRQESRLNAWWSRQSCTSRGDRRRFEILEDRTAPAVIAWTGGANEFGGDPAGNWSLASNWSPAQVPGAADDVVFNATGFNGSSTVDINATVKSIAVAATYAGGAGSVNVAGSGSLTIQTGMSFIGNFIGGAGAVTLASGGVFAIQSGTMLAGAGGWTNFGTLTIGATAAAQLFGGGNFTNQGIVQQGSFALTIQAGTTFTNAIGGAYELTADGTYTVGGGSFVNKGSLRKTAGAGVSANGTFFTNDGGALEAQTGRLQLHFETYINGGVFNAQTGAVVQVCTSASAFQGSFTGSGGGQVRIDGSVPVGSVGATVNFPAGLLHWVSGAVSSTGGAALTVAAGSSLTIDAGSKSIAGSLNNAGVIIHAASTIQIDGGRQLTNLPGGVYDIRFDGFVSTGSGVLMNRGLLKKSAGGGTTSTNSFFANDGGVIQAEVGALSLDFGAYTNGGVLNAFAGAVLMTGAGIGGFSGTFTGAGAGQVQINGGAPTGALGAVVNFPAGLLHWTGGVVASSGGAAFEVAAGSFLVVEGGAKTVTGLFRNFGNLTHVGSTVTVNGGSQFANEPGGVFDIQFDGAISSGSGTFINRGLLTKTTGAATASFGSFFSNPGSVEAHAGTLSASFDATDIAAGTLTQGAWRVFAGSTLLVNSVGSVLANAATILLDGPGAGFPSLSNLAANSGSLTVRNGANLAAPGSFGNSGQLIVGNASLVQVAGNFTQTAGAATVDGTLDPAGAAAFSGGLLQGSGTIAANVAMNAAATLGPGNSPGALTINGDLGMASGSTLAIELNGPITGTQYDRVNVNGTVDLGGAMLTATRGFAPTAGTQFVVIDNDLADGVGSAFAGIAEGQSIAIGGQNFTVSYIGGTGNDVVITAQAPSDALAPSIVGMHFDGTVDSDGAGSADGVWSSAFRTAAGSPSFGYPAQTGANQLGSMPWSTIDTIHIQFSEAVVVAAGNLGVRGINQANYVVSTFNYDPINFVATWVVNGNFDTDRILLDLDGDGAGAVTDLAGNKLAGTWIEGAGAFPTSGAAGVDFLYRFVVAVGDADRNGLVRNADLNAVRNNLFVDAGQPGYSIFVDIDGNGQVRNADLNAVRNHLFVDPPAGPGPFRSIRRPPSIDDLRRDPAAVRRAAGERRLHVRTCRETSIDAVFASFA